MATSPKKAPVAVPCKHIWKAYPPPTSHGLMNSTQRCVKCGKVWYM